MPGIRSDGGVNLTREALAETLAGIPAGDYSRIEQLLASNPPPSEVKGTGAAVYDKGGAIYNALAFSNIKGDGQIVLDGVMNGSNAILTSATAAFVATDVGKRIDVVGAGAGATILSTTILSRQSATQVTLTANSQTAVGAALVFWATDDTTGILAAMATVGPSGGTLYFPPGIYGISATLAYLQKSATRAVRGPSLVGAGPGAIDDGTGPKGVTTFKAFGTFPLGEYLVDYIGSTTTLFAPLCGYRIEGLTFECSFRAAGIRQANHLKTLLKDIEINQPAVPNPADTTGTPTAAVACVLTTGPVDSSWDNVLDHVAVHTPQQDGFQFSETFSSSITAYNCYVDAAIRYGFNAGENSWLIACDSQQCGVADYYVFGATLIGCSEQFPPTKNSVLIDNPFGNDYRESLFIGCRFKGTDTAQTEANGACVQTTVGAKLKVVFSGCEFEAGANTSDWVYIGATGVGSVQLIGCHFNTTVQPITNQFNANGTNILQFVNCSGVTNNPRLRQTPAFNAAPAPDAALGEEYEMAALTGAVNVANPLHSIQGARIRFFWKQDGTGGRAVTYTGSNFRSVGIAAQTTTLNTYTIDEAECTDGTIWRVVRLVTGQAA